MGGQDRQGHGHVRTGDEVSQAVMSSATEAEVGRAPVAVMSNCGFSTVRGSVPADLKEGARSSRL